MPWHHASIQRGIDIIATSGQRDAQARFGLMFPKLSAFKPTDALLEALANTMVDPNTPQLDNATVPSGFTYLAQFLDHDLTRDDQPLAGQIEDPHGTTNFRTPRFDLDNVYGLGSDLEPFLYQGTDLALLALTVPGTGGAPADVLRLPSGTAVIGDSRDDENLIISQLQIAFIQFHNAVANDVAAAAPGATTAQIFADAYRAVRHHYQWMIVHDFLPRVVPQATIDDILTENPHGKAQVRLKYYVPKNPAAPFMPVEFSAAAYRFGHSTIRNGYQMNATTGAQLFDNPQSPADLHGGRPLPASLAIDWTLFFQIPGQPAPTNVTRKIDHLLVLDLSNLPTPQVVGPPPVPPIQVLALRNLLRGVQFQLPSGQEVANAIGQTPITNAEMDEPVLNDPGWNKQAPLWYYILKEAELKEDGQQLGPVGARIVSEVFLGILHFDPNSYFNLPGGFTPQPPYAHAGQFGIAELLKFAGAVP